MNKTQVREQLKLDEGWRSHVYKDHLGYYTIGYGFLVDDRRASAGMPLHVGDYWLDTLIDKKWNELQRHLPWVNTLPEEVQNALANMAYQLGVGGLTSFRRMLAALQRGDRKQAATEALNSRWGSQTPNRAKRIAAMLRGGDV